MEYISTRNSSKIFDFREVFIKGLADDGGLFIPKSLHKVDINELNSSIKTSSNILEKCVALPIMVTTSSRELKRQAIIFKKIIRRIL